MGINYFVCFIYPRIWFLISDYRCGISWALESFLLAFKSIKIDFLNTETGVCIFWIMFVSLLYLLVCFLVFIDFHLILFTYLCEDSFSVLFLFNYCVFFNVVFAAWSSYLQGVPVRVGPVSMLCNICFFWHQDSRICCCFSVIFLV